MAITMNKAIMLELLKKERSKWESLLIQVQESRITEPSVVGQWSVKDIIVHITWYEKEAINLIKTRAMIGSKLWELQTDQRNAVIFNKNIKQHLHDVLTESKSVFQQLVDEIQTLSDEDLVDPHQFAEMPSEFVPWKIIASNSYEHYQQHSPAIRKWLDKSKKRS